MSTIIDRLAGLLQEAEWHHTVDDQADTIDLGLEGSIFDYEIKIFVRRDLYAGTIRMMMPLKTPERIRSRLYEFIALANSSLSFGLFNLQPESGQVFFEMQFPHFPDNMSSQDFTRLLVFMAVQQDKYSPGILRMLYDTCSAQEAYTMCLQAPDGEEAEVEEQS